jgi:DNA polymerase (family X)
MESNMTNEEIAAHLEEVADRLDMDPTANRYRVAAYREGASVVRRLDMPVAAMLREGGRKALEELPGIGEGLAASIEELAKTGELVLLERLREQAHPEQAFETLPGVGSVLAARIHAQLNAETLPELEEAANRGRLREVEGIGPKLERHILEALETRLRRRRTRVPEAEPSIEELLSVDREYREKAQKGGLPHIAPRRFNPRGEAWLPILQTRRGTRRYTALFSNTALAHKLGKTDDWVVLYYTLPRERERQGTVVTGHRGALKGRRIVRGREQECLRYYEETEVAPSRG